MAYRDGPFENLKAPLAWLSGAVVVILIVVAALLVLSDRRGTNAQSAGMRAAGDATVGPVGRVLSEPVRWFGSAGDYVRGYFNAVDENRRLRAQIAELQPWRDQAIALKNINARYEAMLGIRIEPPVPVVTARSISESRGPFGNSRLIDVGSSRGVRVGNPVINEHGLVGRVVGATSGVSRVLLVTDAASRTPVLVDRTDARAILTGDGSGNPRLEFLRADDAVQAGDRILTSGDGGGLPRGVPIGVAARGVDGSWRVKLFSDRGAIDYVKVMLFQDFGQMAPVDTLNAPPLAGLPAATTVAPSTPETP